MIVVGIRFKPAGKIYYFDPTEIVLAEGDGVIVETARGMEYGTVVIAPRSVAASEVVQPLKPIIRKATAKDMRQVERNKEREKKAFTICLEKIAKHKLPMKLIDVDYTFDMGKIIFFFTADGRIDFRELVRDLASVFRTRIELRQIGLRDEAKMIGGIGYCGRRYAALPSWVISSPYPSAWQKVRACPSIRRRYPVSADASCAACDTKMTCILRASLSARTARKIVNNRSRHRSDSGSSPMKAWVRYFASI